MITWVRRLFRDRDEEYEWCGPPRRASSFGWRETLIWLVVVVGALIAGYLFLG